MPGTDVYVDTSALIKCYVAEPFSDDIELFLADVQGPILSSLTVLEWHCAMRRRERAGALDMHYRLLAEAEFGRQMSDSMFRIIPVDHAMFDAARHILDEASEAPLRTLDAIHLAAARASAAQAIVTADRVMARAAKLLGITAHAFLDE